MKLIDAIIEYFDSNLNKDFIKEALVFIKEFLEIKSNIILINKTSKMNMNLLTQDMASVKYINGSYYVTINFSDTKFGIVRRLSHELVHVKQMETGKLRIIDKDKVNFNGTVYTKKDYEKLYYERLLPFEEEAFEKERIIANAFWNR